MVPSGPSNNPVRNNSADSLVVEVLLVSEEGPQNLWPLAIAHFPVSTRVHTV